MPTWLIVAIVVLVLLAIGGAIAQTRRQHSQDEVFAQHVDELNHELAEAHASDRGWQRESLEEAARSALAQTGGADGGQRLTLVQIVDRPGTDDDRAVFRVHSPGREDRTLTLARHAGEWVLLSLD